MNIDDIATKLVREFDPEYLQMVIARTKKIIELTSASASRNPDAVRTYAADLYGNFSDLRDRIAKENKVPKEDRGSIQAAIIAEFIAFLCIAWAGASLARSVEEKLLPEHAMKDPETRQATIETLVRVNYSAYMTLAKHCVDTIASNSLMMTSIYESYLAPEKREKAN